MLVPSSVLARGRDHEAPVDHVLLISSDGLHALDVARFIESHPRSALASLSERGVTYTNAHTPANSDSFPGLLALVTGGSHVSRGALDPKKLPRRLDSRGQCVPVYPHDFVKSNTLFEVVREAGGQRAWACLDFTGRAHDLAAAGP